MVLCYYSSDSLRFDTLDFIRRYFQFVVHSKLPVNVNTFKWCVLYSEH